MKRNGKKIAALVLAAVMALGCTMSSFAAQWHYDGPENWKWWYEHDDGSWTANDWEQINGSWYHFDENGYLDVGWRYYEGDYYYLINEPYDSPDVGKMATSGTYEYGYITADGTAYRYIPEPGENGTVVLVDPSVYYGDDPQLAGSVKTVPDAWYAQIYNDIIEKAQVDAPGGSIAKDQHITMTYSIPANWMETCPSPFIDNMVAYSVGYYDRVVYDIQWMYTWTIDTNANTLTVETWWVHFDDLEE